MEDKYLEYLRNFIGKEWIEKEFEKIEEKTMLKEIGSKYFDYHPFVQFNYELRYLLRRAEAYNQEDVLLMNNYERLIHAGFVLKTQIDKISDLDSFKNRLRDPNQFDDAIWELEVATMLLYNGFSYKIKVPTYENSNDIICHMFDKEIEIECKKRHIIDKKSNVNQVFFHLFCNSLGKIKELNGMTIQIEFELGKYEDIEVLLNEIKKNALVKTKFTILSKYKIVITKNNKNLNPIKILSDDNVRLFVIVGKQKESEIYKNTKFKDDEVTKVIAKFPDIKFNNSGLKNIVKKANTQLLFGGILFLKVPYDYYDICLKEIVGLFKGSYSKIGGIKLIAFGSEFINNIGIKISRREDFIINEFSEYKFSKSQLNFLKSNFAFSAYKNYENNIKKGEMLYGKKEI